MLASVISRVIIHKNDSKCNAESDYTSPEFFVPNWGDRDMAYDDDDDTTTFNVVMNYEEQYSIWPVDRQLPGGWRLAGKPAPKPNAYLISMKCGPTCGHSVCAARAADDFLPC
jgi:hypothetical protein